MQYFQGYTLSKHVKQRKIVEYAVKFLMFLKYNIYNEGQKESTKGKETAWPVADPNHPYHPEFHQESS